MTPPLAWFRIPACLIALGLASSARAQAPTSVDPAALAAAHELMEVTGADKQLDAIFANLLTRLERFKATGAIEVIELLRRVSASRQKLKDEFAAVYAQRFTVEELKAIADFYRTGVGAKFQELSPVLLRQLVAIAARHVEQARRDLQGKQGKK